MKETLRVRYDTEAGIDAKLDKALIELLKGHGWHCWASGLVTYPETRRFGERDLAFDRREVADVINTGI